jgi:hypothetical protein
MRITLQQTGIQGDVGEQKCCICRRRFHLGPAMCQAVDESNVLYGNVCPACVEQGPEHIRGELQYHAWWTRVIAEQETAAANEEVTDCPTLDELLAAETFYERAMYETCEEYDAALRRGEID